MKNLQLGLNSRGHLRSSERIYHLYPGHCWFNQLGYHPAEAPTLVQAPTRVLNSERQALQNCTLCPPMVREFGLVPLFPPKSSGDPAVYCV